MEFNYKQTFDAVRMPPEHQDRIRSVLSSRYSDEQKEDNIVSIKSRSIKKIIVAAVVAVFMLSLLTIVGFAYGSQIIQLLGGGRIEMGRTADGEYITVSTAFESEPVEVRDGKVYFVLDGSNTDITSYCTEETYYLYEGAADNGYRSVVVVGGAPDNLGWAEFVWDENDFLFASNMTYNPVDEDGQKPIWLELAEETFRGAIISVVGIVEPPSE